MCACACMYVCLRYIRCTAHHGRVNGNIAIAVDCQFPSKIKVFSASLEYLVGCCSLLSSYMAL